jgi:hypothetical protein
MDDLAKAEKELAEREAALNEVKAQYDNAVSEKQRLTDAANVCIRYMVCFQQYIPPKCSDQLIYMGFRSS